MYDSYLSEEAIRLPLPRSASALVDATQIWVARSKIAHIFVILVIFKLLKFVTNLIIAAANQI
jgi:hypothetical protein